jgi:P63C domain
MLAMTTDDNEPVGRARGGLARAARLSGEAKREIARKAAMARWGARATHKGNFKEELGIDVDCYVLDDAQKTAVISQSGMARVLGLSPRGNAFPRFLSSQGMSEVIGAELRGKIENPLKFQWGSGGAEQPPVTIHGYDSAILIDVCNGIIEAETQGKLSTRYANIIAQARIITGASAKNGIRDLVYALSGYDAAREEIIAAFKLYVQDEARKYEAEFPNELYYQWHRLYGIPVPVRGKPWQFKHLTINHVYVPLAKSNGKILDLMRALKAQDGDRNKKLFQFLNDLGARALRTHIGRLLEMTESSADLTAYERKVVERFGGQQEFDFASASTA